MRLLITLLFVCVPFSSAYAARLFFEFPEALSTDGTSVMSVFLDTEGVSVNTVSGTLEFGNNVSVQTLRTGTSALSLWVSGPTIEKNIVAFSGAIPNGLSNRRLPLFDMVLSLPSAVGTGVVSGDVFSFRNASESFREDVLVPKTFSWQLETASTSMRFEDTFPPESFSVTVVLSHEAFGNKPVAVFSAVDKQSGIDYFEVQEHKTKTPNVSGWVRAQSPTILTEDPKDFSVSVKAVDRAGNIRVVTVEPHTSSRWLVYVVGALALIVLVYVFLKKRKNRA